MSLDQHVSEVTTALGNGGDESHIYCNNIYMI